MKPMIYVASPYSPTQKCNEEIASTIREVRFKKVNKFMAHCLLNYGEKYVFFGPITHSHPISTQMPIEFNTFAFWVEGQDEHILARCAELWIYMDTGWEKSHGIEREIKLAKSMGIPIRYFNKTTYKEVVSENS